MKMAELEQVIDKELPAGRYNPAMHFECVMAQLDGVNFKAMETAVRARLLNMLDEIAAERLKRIGYLPYRHFKKVTAPSFQPKEAVKISERANNVRMAYYAEIYDLETHYFSDIEKIFDGFEFSPEFLKQEKTEAEGLGAALSENEDFCRISAQWEVLNLTEKETAGRQIVNWMSDYYGIGRIDFSMFEKTDQKRAWAQASNIDKDFEVSFQTETLSRFPQFLFSATHEVAHIRQRYISEENGILHKNLCYHPVQEKTADSNLKNRRTRYAKYLMQPIERHANFAAEHTVRAIVSRGGAQMNGPEAFRIIDSKLRDYQLGSGLIK